MFTTLVDAATLAANLDAPDWRLVDCRFDLRDSNAGRRAYEAGHLPNAVFADLEADLSGPIHAASGRHPLPDRAALAHRLGELGIGPRTQVVAYDDQTGAFAARLWWLMRWLGHDHVALLDGGLQNWRAQGLPITDAPAKVTPCELPLYAPLERAIGSDEVFASLHDPSRRLIDARAPERYRGDVEPIDPVAGHVPGAINHPLALNLTPDGHFLDAEELRRRYTVVLDGHPPQVAAAMCGSGVTACHNLLALTIAGLHGAALYAGSWSEWIRDPARPVVRGPQP